SDTGRTHRGAPSPRASSSRRFRGSRRTSRPPDGSLFTTRATARRYDEREFAFSTPPDIRPAPGRQFGSPANGRCRQQMTRRAPVARIVSMPNPAQTFDEVLQLLTPVFEKAGYRK